MDRSRSGRRERQKTQRIAQLPWRQIRNSHRVTDILSSDQVEKIHLNSLEVLESIGVEFLLPEACDLLAAAGASVDPETARVRLDRGLVMEYVSKAPSAFHIHARNPSHDIHIGGRSLVFATVASAPNASDSTRGRRPGNFADYENFLRLAQVLNITHTTGGYPVEPTDVPAETRHL
ncbi:MAG TPA: trimethylamine methyltransferase family protein, partial [Dongiaceae bacterium]